MKTIVAVLILTLSNVALAKGHRHVTPKEAFDETTVKAPLENEVCFSPDEHCDVKLYKLIQTAQKSIDIAICDPA